MKSHRFSKILLTLSFLYATTTQMHADEIKTQPETSTTENTYDMLATMHLPTMSAEESQEETINNTIEQNNEELEKKWFNIGGVVQIPALGKVETLRQAYIMFGAQESQNENINKTQTEPVSHLEKATIEDLEIFSGQESNLQRHVLALFEPYLHTAIGKIQLQKMLYQPLTNSHDLQERQNKIKALLVNAVKLEQLNKKLTDLTNAEREFLWFWKNLGKKTFEQLEKDAVPTILPLPTVAMKRLEKTPIATEISSKGSIAAKTLTNPIVWCLLAGSYALYKCGWTNCKEKMKQAYKNRDLILKIASNNSGLLAFYGAYLGILTSLSTYQTVKEVAAYNGTTNAIHTKMNGVAQFIKTTHELLGPDTFGQEAKEVEELVTLLNTATFNNKPSFFSYKGRAISAFTLMSELKKHFVSMLEKIGKLDAEVAIARFMQTHVNNKNGNYCFPLYAQNDKPYLKINNYWHPFLDAQTVITNDIELGGNSAKNIIVTGPNAGGKSTALKSLTLAVILAQTLTIAPASAMALTPFKQINTYMNITDNAGSESLFQAEMHRAARLIEMVKTQKPNDFIFVVMDELFTGTNPLEGKSAAYGVIKKLVDYNNSMLIFVTHYKELTELEKETNGLIKNFKVWVNQDTENGKISYPYKLAPGVSNQTIALDLLAQDGFDKDILSNAYTMLSKLKKQLNNN